MAQHDGVEPARPAAAARVGAVLVAAVDERVADLVEQLGGERPGPDPGDVGLGDADHPVDVAGPDPGARAGAAGHRVGRGHVGIGAVVEVEERGLGALEQHVLPGLERLVHQVDRVGHVGLDAGASSPR